MAEAYDVAVIGGGFAGSTAARELTARGHSVVLLEGRDRLGGRTWYRNNVLEGFDLELGGTWVHWVQPHVFAEITRYGLDLVESPGAAAPERCVWISNGERKEAPFEEVWPILEDAIERFCHDAREVLERPYEPLVSPRLTEVDALSVEERIQQIDVSDDQRDMLNAIWSLCISGYCREGGLISMMRWYALSGWDVGMVFDAATRYKLKTGTRSLVEAIAGDSSAEIMLSTPVSALSQSDTGVVVQTRNGDSISAAAAIVTVPLNTLRYIEFSPDLTAAKRQEAQIGQASHGSKVWVRLRGELPVNLFAMAPEDHAFTYFHTEKILEDGQMLVGFGPDAAAIDVTDRNAVQRAIEPLFPGTEVVACAGHDWLSDEFSRGTWPVLRPGQTVRGLTELQRPQGRIFFGGSETANGWNGFIDGAIESGLRTSREVHTFISTHQAARPVAV